MKKVFLYCLLSVTLFIACSKEDAIKIKDVDDVCTIMDDIEFKRFCYENYDVNHDGMVSMSEASSVSNMNISQCDISSLKGIEYFTNLKILDCHRNYLTSLDMSRNRDLMDLNCSHNSIGSLDLSKNTSLVELNCSNNKSLASLNILKCAEITDLNCYDCSLTSLDVSRNAKLEYLQCAYNELKSIVFAKTPALTQVFCYHNNLASLDLSGLTNLSELDCRNNDLSSLDVSKLLKLRVLECSNNNLTMLDVSNNLDITVFECNANLLSSLDISSLSSLIRDRDLLFDLGEQKNDIMISITDKKEYWRYFKIQDYEGWCNIIWIWK